MIYWLKSWTNSIIVAVIIAVIFNLIIPNGNNKKYIKMVISLYLLFVILNPLISKFTNLNSLDINAKDYKKYFSCDESLSTSASLNSDKLISTTAEKTIKENIKSKLKQQGYKASNISIYIDNKNGQINKLKLSVEKENIREEDTNKSNNSISINEVEHVDISSKNTSKKDKLRKSEIQKIKKIINENYEISEENIDIN